MVIYGFSTNRNLVFVIASNNLDTTLMEILGSLLLALAIITFTLIDFQIITKFNNYRLNSIDHSEIVNNHHILLLRSLD